MSPTQEAQSPSRPSSPSLSVLSDGGATTSRNSDEEVNLEYLRNVIMQFLEHKEMRVRLFRTSVMSGDFKLKSQSKSQI
jgi:hypothetical protein